MSKKGRLALVACAAFASLAFAGTALASYAPKIVVTSTDDYSLSAGVVISNADTPTAKVAIYIPSQYSVATAAPGKLGSVTATASAADLGGAVLPLTGELDAIAPTAATIAAAQQCGVTPAQTWNLHLTAAGQSLDIPMFVVASQVPGYPWSLVVCLPPPDVPTGTPGRATFGAKLLSATFSASAIKDPPTGSGDLRWTSLWTPYNPGVGTVNASGTVEVQSNRPLPVAGTFSHTQKRIVKYKTVNGKRVKQVSTKITWTTNVTENSKPPADVVTVVLYKNKIVGRGTGSLTVKGVKSVQLTVAMDLDGGTGSIPTGQPAGPDDLYYHDLGAAGCIATPAFQGLPCTNGTLGEYFILGKFTIKTFTK
jgi:hypothetical protein